MGRKDRPFVPFLWKVGRKDRPLVPLFQVGSKGFQDADTGWDIQKIDIGIALKHFVMGAEEAGYKPQILVEDPQIAAPENVEYRVSCIL